MPRAIQRFEVSLKAFVIRDRRVLVVREADTGYWELPGGRIDVGEEWDPHEKILAREISEELGAQFRVAVGIETVTWTRRRPVDGAFLFIVGRVCRHTGGEPELSDEHDRFDWIGPGAERSLGFPPESGYVDAFAELWRLGSGGKP